jgi:NAD(P)-dependent dehydrogenase (short-subunit alcohol dehydrogenase family)
MSHTFAGKVVLITGGALNLGRTMGMAFAATGAMIAVIEATKLPAASG